MSRTLVLGVGNVLAGDDGLGPYVIATLGATWHFPREVELLDAGTPGPGLFAELEEVDSLIVIDSIDLDEEAGELHEYRKEDLLIAPVPLATSCHQPQLRDALLGWELIDRGPTSIYVVGVVPERVTVNTGLSDAVRKRVPDVCARVITELCRLGQPPEPRQQPLPVPAWWDPAAVRASGAH